MQNQLKPGKLYQRPMEAKAVMKPTNVVAVNKYPESYAKMANTIMRAYQPRFGGVR